MRSRSVALALATLAIAGACSKSSKTVVLEPTPSMQGASTNASSGGVRPSTAATLGVPPGHLPNPGECRIWIPGRPPGHQPQAGECRALRAEVPVGAWLVYRPSSDRQHVEVTVYDLKRPRVVVAVRVYDSDSGRLVR